VGNVVGENNELKVNNLKRTFGALVSTYATFTVRTKAQTLMLRYLTVTFLWTRTGVNNIKGRVWKRELEDGTDTSQCMQLV
jgi:hypothetical protein